MKLYLYFSCVFWMLLAISAAIPRSRKKFMASLLPQINPLLNKAQCCRSSPVGIGLISKQLPIGFQAVVNQLPVGFQGFNNPLPVGIQAIGNPNQLPLVKQGYVNQLPASIRGIGNPNQLPFGVQGFGNQLSNGVQGIDYQSRSVGIAGINYQTPIGGEIDTQLPLGVGQIGNQIPAGAGEINTQLIASISQLQAGIEEITNQLPVGVGGIGYPAQPEIGMNGFQPPIMRRLSNEKLTESEKTIKLLREVINLGKEKKDGPLPNEPVQEIDRKVDSEKAYECSLLKCSPDELKGPVCACNYNTGNTVSFKDECDVKKHNCRFRTGFKTILKEVCPWQYESRTGAKMEHEIFNYEDPRYQN